MPASTTGMAVFQLSERITDWFWFETMLMYEASAMQKMNAVRSVTIRTLPWGFVLVTIFIIASVLGLNSLQPLRMTTLADCTLSVLAVLPRMLREQIHVS